VFPDLITTKRAEIALKLIPAGRFTMGSPAGEGGDDERPQHEVTISRAFYLGTLPVTQAQYEKLIGKNPSHFSATGHGKAKVATMDTSRFPAETVSFWDAAYFCNALSKAEGIETYYSIQAVVVDEILGGSGYRLPTEAEWEYACRAGNTSPYGFDDGEDELPQYAWFCENSDERTHTVGERIPNRFGIHDVHGNVMEWTLDGYEHDYYSRSPATDPRGPSSFRSPRVLRGGCWYFSAEQCRSASRFNLSQQRRRQYMGFRIARDP
jgi:formylglycine-generating enzyme required for sulfatase activity